MFYKDASGEIFHTYSTYGRGLDILLGTYNFLDMVPKGRDEDGLDFTMSWVRHHDKYEDKHENGHAVQVKTPSVRESDCGCEAPAKTAQSLQLETAVRDSGGCFFFLRD